MIHFIISAGGLYLIDFLLKAEQLPGGEHIVDVLVFLDTVTATVAELLANIL